MKKLFPLILLLLSAAGLSAQQSYIQLFDRILAIEDSISEEITDSLLAEIDEVREALSNSPYPDLQTRIDIIDHIIKTIKTSQKPEDMGELLEKDAGQIKSQNNLKAFNTWTIISASVSIAATATLTTSFLLAESAHDQMLAAKSLSKLGHFSWVTDIFDTASWISGGVLALGIGSMATLIALRPPSNEISGSENIQIDPLVLSANNPDHVIRELMAKRKKLIQLIDEEEASREKNKFWLDLGLYTGIGSLGSTALFLVLGMESFYRLNNTYDPQTVEDLEDWSKFCQGMTAVSGILSVVGFTTFFILDNSNNGKDLRERLNKLDRTILNYPFR